MNDKRPIDGEEAVNALRPKCRYADRELGYTCRRLDEGSGRCRFHEVEEPPSDRTSDKEELDRLLQNGDGRWVGFQLRDDVTFTDLVIEHQIDLRRSELRSLSFKRCVFRHSIDVSGATFNGRVDFEGCTFEREFTAKSVRFAGEVRWSSTTKAGATTFEGSTFGQRAKFLGAFDGPVSFNRCTFFDVTDFVGGWLHVAVAGGGGEPPPAEPRYLFNAGVHLEQIDFRRPERVQFRKVDLRKAYTTDTDFRKVRFYDTLWFQKELGRNGLFHEVDAASDKSAATRYAALWEANYRNIRLALEDSKDFNAATDFYVGEMHWRRYQLHFLRKRVFSVEAMYCYLSNYGGSPLRAFGWLVLLLISYGLFVTLSSDEGCLRLSNNCSISPELVARAASLLEVYKLAPGAIPLKGWWGIGETLFKVAAVVQLALLVLALRNRIRRG